MNSVQSRMARAALNLGIREVAALAKVSPTTVTKIEAGDSLKPRTIEAVKRAFENAGLIFLDDDTEGPGVRLKK